MPEKRLLGDRSHGIFVSQFRLAHVTLRCPGTLQGSPTCSCAAAINPSILPSNRPAVDEVLSVTAGGEHPARVGAGHVADDAGDMGQAEFLLMGQEGVLGFVQVA